MELAPVVARHRGGRDIRGLFREESIPGNYFR